MISKIKSAAIAGTHAIPITVEVDASKGLPQETIVGLPDAVVRESKKRIKSAVKHSDFDYPLRAYTINLAPANIKKEGPLLDLAIAVGILQATQQLPSDTHTIFLGELSLDGSVNAINGILPICYDFSRIHPLPAMLIPIGNTSDVSLVSHPKIFPIRHLNDIQKYYSNSLSPITYTKPSPTPYHHTDDYQDVYGQLAAKRALEIAVAGHHNILFIGPPGSGKTMLVKRIPSILPDLPLKKVIETQKIYSVSPHISPLRSQWQPPFRSPHHSISYAGLTGGGTPPIPGEISLAHNGILFMDELPEFSNHVINMLRQPLEDKKITINRSGYSMVFNADFMLAATMNPCPCGYYKDPFVSCQCHPSKIVNYWKKISGPIIDRFDIIVEVPRLKKADYFSPGTAWDNSTQIKQRILHARTHRTNRSNTDQIMSAHTMTPDIQNFLEKAVQKGLLTGRSFHKTLHVARTIADIDTDENVRLPHVTEALQYRLITHPCYKSSSQFLPPTADQ